jgi:hypothetical protein
MRNVYYAFDKIGGQRKMQSISIIYENESSMQSRFFRTLNNVTHQPFYTREQNEHEWDCSTQETRVFSIYAFFFKDYKDLNHLLNFLIEDDKVLSIDENEKEKFIQSVNDNLTKTYGTNLQFKNKKTAQKQLDF